MTPRVSEGGFTLIEVMIAVIILGIGLTALAGGSALVTRQVSRGRVVTVATQLATQKLDSLRMLAAIPNGGGARCTHWSFVSGGPSATRGVTLNWRVLNGAAARTRDVAVTVSYATLRGARTVTLNSTIGCY
ncbi:MAG: type IV pilus modification PilV family protein [Gemmatimonadales bacterium]